MVSRTAERELTRSILLWSHLAEGVKAKIYFKALANEGEDGRTYLTTDAVKMDFNVKDIQMGVDNIANGNTVIRKSKRIITQYGNCLIQS